MKVNEIFVPTGQPTYTYVPRNEERLERHLKDSLETPNMVVSISGPSKSGKTVLFRRVVAEGASINISGSQIRSVEDFWKSLMYKLSSPNSITKTSSSASTGEASLGASAGLSAVIAKGSATGAAKYSSSDSQATTKTHLPDPFSIVAESCANGEIIFVDDFHYIPISVQVEIAKILKSLAERGVRFCIASVPHKSDDAVRANPELRGRLAAVQVEMWSLDELCEIGKKGFSALKMLPEDEVIPQLASEALGSPQLMQALCLNLCREAHIREPFKDITAVKFTSGQVKDAKKMTASLAEFSTLVQLLHSGPKPHGNDRKDYEFIDGSKGDSYRAFLIAISVGGPRMQFDYDDLTSRLKSVCIGEYPRGSNFIRILPSIAEIAKKNSGASPPVIDWSDDLLTITDPYFSFYLRSSDAISRLAKS